jgi:hydroxyethylthiazole kinase
MVACVPRGAGGSWLRVVPIRASPFEPDPGHAGEGTDQTMSSLMPPGHLVPRAQIVRTLQALRQQAPRVQCLTSPVAQPITANCLLALGARVSMATHPDEVIDMTTSADALLINLGMLDQARQLAIPLLLADPAVHAKPLVLDPVFVQHAPLRRQLAQRVLQSSPVIIKGNAAEIAALDVRSTNSTSVTTGPVDHVQSGARHTYVKHGHPHMALVTGVGCAAGAVIAACSAVEPDPFVAATAAMTIIGLAGTYAGRTSSGSGSFAVAFIDALSDCDEPTLAQWLADAPEAAS